MFSEILKLSEYYIVLTASKVDELKKQYPNLINEIDYYKVNDPSNGRNKYLLFYIKTLLKYPVIKPEEILNVIKLFENNIHKLNNKDINSYDIYELKKILITKELEKSKSDQKREIKESGASKIYEDDNCIVIFIKNKEAANYYGFGTRWCISGRNDEDGSFKKKDFFSDYEVKNTIFYFIINKNTSSENNYHKLAVVIDRNENNEIENFHIFSADDKEIFNPSIENWEKIKQIILSNAKSQPKTFLNKIQNNDTDVNKIFEKINNPGVAATAMENLDVSKLNEDQINILLDKMEDVQFNTLDKFLNNFPSKYYYKLLDKSILSNKSYHLIQFLTDNVANKVKENNIEFLNNILEKSDISIDNKKYFKNLVLKALAEKIKKTAIQNRIIKLAATIDMGEPVEAGKRIAEIIKFLLKRIDPKSREKSLYKLKKKIWNLNEWEMSSKKMPASSSLGISISFIKNILNGHPAPYIRSILGEIYRNL